MYTFFSTSWKNITMWICTFDAQKHSMFFHEVEKFDLFFHRNVFHSKTFISLLRMENAISVSHNFHTNDHKIVTHGLYTLLAGQCFGTIRKSKKKKIKKFLCATITSATINVTVYVINKRKKTMVTKTGSLQSYFFINVNNDEVQ